MKLLTAELRQKLPPLYSQEKAEDPVVHAKFLYPGFQLDLVRYRRLSRGGRLPLLRGTSADSRRNGDISSFPNLRPQGARLGWPSSATFTLSQRRFPRSWKPSAAIAAANNER